MKKRILSAFLILFLCVTLTPLTVRGAAVSGGGKCGDNLTWSLSSDGTLTISGTGTMYNYDPYWDESSSYAPWTCNYETNTWTSDAVKTVVIGQGVDYIGIGAFQMCYNLQSVTIPSSVRVIDAGAFSSCNALKNIAIPEGVIAIGAHAFNDCMNLTSVSIPQSMVVIGERAFSCPNLKDVYYAGTESQWGQIQMVTTILGSPFGVGDARPVFHYNANTQDSLTVDSINVTVNNTAIRWTDTTPYIDSNGRTMVPLRAVADAMGLTVGWDGDKREASFTNGAKTIIFPIGNASARTGQGEVIPMDTAAVIVDGRTYAPIRYLAEFFDYAVSWDGSNRTVRIS